jgi:lipoate-protein ligase A
MAIDEAILEAHLAGLVPPTLRLYGFEPPAVSVGYTQKVPDVLLARARAGGFDVVRRPTGGRAVLHSGDFTYSFVASSKRRQEPGGAPIAVTHKSSGGSQATSATLRSESPGGHTGEDGGLLVESVSGAYKQICQGLQNAFNSLGLDLALGGTDVPYRQLHDCFLATTGSDLQFKGKKMVGSAQLRRRTAVLQHGSILLDQPQSLLPELLGRTIGVDDIGIRHANLFDALGARISHAELEAAIKNGFESAFGAQFQDELLSEHEIRLVDQFKSKYQTM